MAPKLTITPMQDLKIYYAAMVSDLRVTVVCKNQQYYETYWQAWMQQFSNVMVDAAKCSDGENVSSLLVWLYGIYKGNSDSKFELTDDFYFGPRSFRSDVKFPKHKIFRCSFKIQDECIFKVVPQCGIRNEAGVLQCTVEAKGSLRMRAIECSDARSFFSRDPFIMLGEAYQQPKKTILEGESSNLKNLGEKSQ